MRNAIISAVFTVLVLASAAQADDINWLGSYKEALSAAKQTGKPIFLEYRCEP